MEYYNTHTHTHTRGRCKFSWTFVIIINLYCDVLGYDTIQHCDCKRNMMLVTSGSKYVQNEAHKDLVTFTKNYNLS